MGHVAGLLLAAGGSRRMGRPKQLLSWRGVSLVRRAAETALASRCDEVVVVVGAARDEVESELEGLAVRCVVNPAWQDGIASSLRAGIGALGAEVDAALVLLGDQPRVETALLDALIGAWETSGLGLVACAYGGGVGAPALFAQRYFAELGTLEGDRGARLLLEAHAEDCARVNAPQAALDLDTPEDLAGV